METIQVVLEKDLLRAADHAAAQVRMNRSALIRQALRDYLKKLHYKEMERRDREGYGKHPDKGDLSVWEGVAAWPGE